MCPIDIKTMGKQLIGYIDVCHFEIYALQSIPTNKYQIIMCSYILVIIMTNFNVLYVGYILK